MSLDMVPHGSRPSSPLVLTEPDAYTASRTQVTAAHYRKTGSYEGRKRHYSYVEQIVQTVALDPNGIVEVGIGTGYVNRALRGMGYDVTSVDFAADLRPDIVASVTDIPLPDGYADMALCFQTLEHLPFEEFPTALRQLRRIARRSVYLSLPDCRPYCRLEVSRGWLHEKTRRWNIPNPFWKPHLHGFDGQHYWEIGASQTQEATVLQAIASAGLTVEWHYRLHLNPYHHFLMLSV